MRLSFISFTILLFFLNYPCFSQTPQFTCLSADLLNAHLDANPNEKVRSKTIEKEITQSSLDQSKNRISTDVIYIPVVVHILYNTEIENISNQQIHRQIEILNSDFSNSGLNQPDLNWDQNTDVQLQFYLASQDPNGNSTTGITRTETTQSEFELIPGISYDAAPNYFMKSSNNGGIDAWPTDTYLNIWVADLSDTRLGFSTFPGIGNENHDGIVINYPFFSDIGTGATYENYDKGRTLVHETGHWLGLKHIWGDGACGVDDLVEDTPAQSTYHTGCPDSPVSCGSTDMAENFMDYTFDGCMSLFTEGQKNRIHAVFEAGQPRSSFMTNQPKMLFSKVWMDYNANNVQEYNEPGIPDLNVNIHDPNGTILYQSSTNEVGQIIQDITDLNQFYLSYDIPSIYTLTEYNHGNDVKRDSDVFVDGNIVRTNIISASDAYKSNHTDCGLVLFPNGDIPQNISIHCEEDLEDPMLSDIQNVIGNSVTITYADIPNQGTGCVGDPRIIERKFIFKDFFGLTTNKSQYITIEKTIHFPIVNMDTTYMEPETTFPDHKVVFENHFDVCNDPYTVFETVQILSGTGAYNDPQLVEKEFILKDCGGNEKAYFVYYILRDTTPPSAQIPEDITLSCFPNLPIPSMEELTEIIDFCEVNVEGSMTDNGGSGNNADPLVISRNYKIMDCGGLFVEKTQYITIVDSLPPTANQPLPILVEYIEDIPLQSIENLTNLEDNCDATLNAIITDNIISGTGTFIDPMTIDRIYEITDNHHLTSIFHQSITVQAPPIFLSLNDIHLSAKIVNGNSILLTWEGKTNGNIETYLIQKMDLSNINFKTIGEVRETNQLESLTFIDNSKEFGVHYFRIIGINSQNETSVSNIVSIENNKNQKSNIKIYPNPFNDAINLKLETSKTYDITLYNLSGLPIFNEVINGQPSYIMNTSDLMNQMYLLKIKDGENVVIQKMVKR